jgi:hypothetical protein
MVQLVFSRVIGQYLLKSERFFYYYGVGRLSLENTKTIVLYRIYTDEGGKAMRARIFVFMIALGILGGICLCAQDEANPATEAGENLDLHGVLELFRVAENLEALEKALNQESSEVNNLDLDENGDVDYVRLEEHVEGLVHVIVLQVPLGENDYQDVATIEIEKMSDNDFTLQIVGNEELYGENYIIEPSTDAQGSLAQSASKITADDRVDSVDKLQLGTSEGLFLEYIPGESSLRSSNSAVVIVIGALPIVRIMFRPGYRPWISPWRWRRWPGWWKPWRPVARSIHLSRVRKFHQHHWRHVNSRRSAHSHKVYRAKMKSSPKAVKKKAPPKKVKPAKKKPPSKKKKKKKLYF